MSRQPRSESPPPDVPALPACPLHKNSGGSLNWSGCSATIVGPPGWPGAPSPFGCVLFDRAGRRPSLPVTVSREKRFAPVAAVHHKVNRVRKFNAQRVRGLRQYGQKRSASVKGEG
jgi:hypothetical protein